MENQRTRKNDKSRNLLLKEKEDRSSEQKNTQQQARKKMKKKKVKSSTQNENVIHHVSEMMWWSQRDLKKKNKIGNLTIKSLETAAISQEEEEKKVNEILLVPLLLSYNIYSVNHIIRLYVDLNVYAISNPPVLCIHIYRPITQFA